MTDKRSLPPRIWTALLLLGFSGQLAWGVENQYFNTFLYENITPDPRPISWMVAASALTATLTTILMGALSDRTRKGWGKRKLFILAGYLAWGVFTALFPAAAYLRPVGLAIGIAILFDSIMTFFGSTANDAALNAYVTDVTTDQNRGRVVGVMQILTWVAILIVYGASGLIIDAWGYFTFFYMVGGLVFVLGLAGGLLVRETPDTSPVQGSYWGQIADSFRTRTLRKNRDLFLLLFALTLYGIAEQIFFPYLIIYLNHHLQLPTTQSSLVIFVCILVGGILLAYPFGLLADRVGRRKLAFGAIFIKMTGLILFSLTGDLLFLTLTGILWLAGMSAWMIATGAWTKDLYPEDRRGQFAGYFILFTVAFTMIPGPLIGGWLASTFGTPIVLDGQPGFVPPPLVFQIAGLATLLAALPLLAVKDRRPDKEDS
ncbi:MAG: MFS transporter [Anaerolineales bacterium]|nr:MFS transporter [Anaerolineales bacterium]